MDNSQTLLKLLNRFLSVDPTLPAASVVTMLYCMRHEGKNGGLSVKDVGAALGLSTSASSRYVNYWAGGPGTKGPTFLLLRPDPTDARRTNITLTPRGKMFKIEIEEVDP